MKHDLTRREKLGLALGVLLIVLNLCGLWLLLRRQTRPMPSPEPTAPISTGAAEPTLAGEDFFLPENLAFGEKLPITQFQDGAGQTVDLLQAYPGQRLVLMYWGSWCPYCEEQLESLEQFQRSIAAQGNTRLILVNKTDAGKEETIQTGETYLRQKQWDQYDHVYDVDLKAYRAYGMKRIPTTIITDEAGYVRAVESKVLSAEALEELLEQARFGNEKKQLAFLEKNMMNADGGIYAAYLDASGTSPKGHDVLSESMGLLMRCAVQLEDQTLFDRCWAYVSQKMLRDGVCVWYVTEDGAQGTSNALLDDLRIARALYEAEEKWGGYAQPLEALAAGIQSRNTYRGQLCSFYDFRQKKTGRSISLAYGDFAALDALAQVQPEYADLRGALLQIVQDGFIGEQLPLYYASFDYRSGKYSRDSLNTAEALLTVYHLSEIGQARQETLQWLKNELQAGTLAARYRVDGGVVAGFQYDSTAVFAIAALIGQSTGDGELYRLARQKMEQYWLQDQDDPLYGAFSQKEDGSDIQSFDQLLPLTVYCQGQNVRF